MKLSVRMADGDLLHGDETNFEDIFSAATRENPDVDPHIILGKLVEGVQELVDPMEHGVTNLSKIFILQGNKTIHFNTKHVQYIIIEGVEEMLQKIIEAEEELNKEPTE